MTKFRLAKVLLIEHSPDVSSMVLHSLTNQYSIAVATCKAEALKLLDKEFFDLVIMDVQLADGDGLSLCAELKSKEPGQQHGVFFLTSKSSIEDKVLGFAAGADDYLVQPVDPRELLARVEAKLRNRLTLRRGLRVGDLWLDFERQTAYAQRIDGDAELKLTGTEFRLLAFLAQNEGCPLDRDRILNYVWGEDRYLGDRSVDVYVSSLRRKMQGMRCLIQTVYKTGYTLTIQRSPSYADQA
jgi:DNA-binding response OmpR family regulator